MLNIVLPMAGRGSRFAEAGYTTPKPLIEIHGVPMIKVVVDNLTPKCEHRFIFVCQQEHIEKYNLEPKLKSYAKNVEIIGINGNSQMVKLFRSQYRTGIEITSISFLGRMEAENIVEVLLHSDLYVHPSYIDNSPNSLCEAQILGVPVIACNVGGVSSLVENGVTGLLIPANGVYELASIIKNYKSYPMNKFSANEISHAETRHNMKRVVQSLIDSYKECTK